MRRTLPLLFCLGLISCAPTPQAPTPPPTPSPTASVVVTTSNAQQQLNREAGAWQLHETHSKLPAFTQGLEFVSAGGEDYLAESTGHYGQSRVHRYDREGNVTGHGDLPTEIFAEGLTQLPDGDIVVGTWKENQLLRIDPETLSVRESITDAFNVWGLCVAADTLWVADGSSTVTSYDPASLTAKQQVQVTRDGQPLTKINELECGEDFLLANEWQTTLLHRIDLSTGQVDATWDLGGLAKNESGNISDPRNDVLNGIAIDPANPSRVWVTGKNWHHFYVIQLD